MTERFLKLFELGRSLKILILVCKNFASSIIFLEGLYYTALMHATSPLAATVFSPNIKNSQYTYKMHMNSYIRVSTVHIC